MDPDMINCMILCIHVEKNEIILSHSSEERSRLSPENAICNKIGGPLFSIPTYQYATSRKINENVFELPLARRKLMNALLWVFGSFYPRWTVFTLSSPLPC